MSSPDSNPLELLAPAGQLESLRAAIANGADAVYLGGRAFNARLRAENFGPDELKEARELTGRCNVRLYVTMNTLLSGEDLEQAARQLEELARLGVDAVIVQDAGLLELASAMAPSLPLHASTQATLTEPLAIHAAQQRWAIRRVILPRETSLAALAEIRRQTSVELEVFCHGAMCISYSGQCHASRVLGGRSGNKGQCAQPCRLAWQLVADGRPGPRAGRHVLSPRDLCLVDRLAELAEAGATGFKIEGRAKGPAYVAAIVGVYRRALDAVLEGRPAPISAADRYALAMSFSRGFTQGYADGQAPERLTGGAGPGNMGLRIGSVLRVEADRVVIALDGSDAALAQADLAIRPGDGVAFGEPDDTGRGPGAAVYEVDVPRPGRCVLGLDRQALGDLSVLSPGMQVWKTSDAALLRRLRQSHARLEPRRRRSLDIAVHARPGEPLVLRSGELAVASAAPLEAARQHPLTLELLREQLGRLGNTPFELGRLELHGPAGPCDRVELMAPKSILNELRRRLVEQAAAAARAAWPVIEPAALDRLRRQAAWPPGQAAPATVLAVLVRQVEQLGPVLDALTATGAAGRVYLELPLEQLAGGIDAVRAAGHQPALVGPRLIGPADRARVERLLELPGQAMLVRNLGTLALLRQRRPQWLAVGGAALNIANELAARAMFDMGLALLTPAGEVDSADLARLLSATGPGRWELPVYRHEELFFTWHCLFSAHLGNGQPYPRCGQPCKRHRLELRHSDGRRYSIRQDELGKTSVLEPRARQMDVPAVCRPGALRIELLEESQRETASIVRQWAGACWAGLA